LLFFPLVSVLLSRDWDVRKILTMSVFYLLIPQTIITILGSGFGSGYILSANLVLGFFIAVSISTFVLLGILLRLAGFRIRFLHARSATDATTHPEIETQHPLS